MNQEQQTRRLILRLGGAALGAAALAPGASALAAVTEAAHSALRQDAPFQILTVGEARDLAAIAARIIPTTATPGATEAGVIYFLDSALGSMMRTQLEAIRSGLAQFNAALATAHPEADGFPGLPEDHQDTFLVTREDSPFFGQLRFLTFVGFFAMSEYGGNRGDVGWNLIDFHGHHTAWQYPFGHYDGAAGKDAGNDG